MLRFDTFLLIFFFFKFTQKLSIIRWLFSVQYIESLFC